MSEGAGKAGRKEPGSLSVLLRIPVFRRLWLAISVSSLGDWLGLLATTSLAAYLTKESSGLAQGAAISGVLIIRLLPDLVLGPVAGALVDRFDRRVIAVIGDTSAGLLYLSIALTNNLVWLLVAQFLVEAVGLFSNPAKQAMWVNIVPRERLAVANQLNYVSIYGMVPVAAGLFALLSTISQFFGASALADDGGGFSTGPTSALAINIALIVDAATYFLCAGTVLFSRHLIPAFVEGHGESKSVFSLIGEGIRFIKNSRIMRSIYLGILGAFLAGGLTAGVAQAYVYGLGAGTAGYSILFGSVFTGLAVGMLIGPKVLPTIPRRMIFTSSIGAAGLVLLVMSVLQDFIGAVVAAVVMGLFAGIAWITGFTMIGHEVSDSLRGRVFSFVMSSVRITLLATIAAGPVVAGAIGAQSVMVGDFSWTVSGAGIVLACGGVIAVGVSIYTGRQVGGVVGGMWRRLARGRRGMLSDPGDHPGVLIVLEGADQQLVRARVDRLAAELAERGFVVRPAIGEPIPDQGDTPADALRAAAGLSDLVGSDIRAALEDGNVVLVNGYIDDLVVRFGAIGGLGEDAVLKMASWAVDRLMPDLTVVIDIDPGHRDPAAPDLDPAAPDLEPAAPDLDPAGPGSAAAGTGSEGVGPGGSPAPVAPDATGDVVISLEDIAQAYRERASTAPERYLVVPPSADDDLGAEALQRIESVLRTRSPRTGRQQAGEVLEPVEVST
ncbi:dTMP kinase [Nakamurella sp. YIM 132087]|uniref:dTMP kinase n=1 Tax=Nakamurella alba TaxID=2665158 RepID=A0A7K1FUZ8_9ACTN|nr:MFS transporter [Nakamurella alba]MTD17023.1 dTMP kinase [Nakamurella alba]